MTPYSLASTLNKKFVLEPVVSQSGAFVGFELLTRYTSEAGKSRNAHMVIENMRYEEKREFLFEQLNLLSSILMLLEQHQLFISINIDQDMVQLLQEDERLCRMFSASSIIRLEISENVDFLPDHAARHTLQQLKEHGIRFFLGDLGTGFANLEALYTGLFDAVKIDKRFFWEQKDKPIFPVLMKNIRRFCPLIIVVGVEDDEDLATLAAVPVYGIQGYRYAALAPEELAQRLSQNALSSPPRQN
ncbi:EAL domain-containing protein [Pantoea osteomyelitidis]|uniref:EAL domain-containing protein n=1 Tax=Pantoea osteomyelitidis TaxID=3230026 RepID=A0ABW7PTV2_9GAMM